MSSCHVTSLSFFDTQMTLVVKNKPVTKMLNANPPIIICVMISMGSAAPFMSSSMVPRAMKFKKYHNMKKSANPDLGGNK